MQISLRVRNWPIQRKLLMIILAAISASLALVLVGIAVYEITTYRTHLMKEVPDVGDFLAANSAPTLAFDDPKTAREILQTVRATPELTVAALYAVNGQVFASYVRATRSFASVPPKPGPAGLRIRGSHIELVRPVKQKGVTLGTLYLRADMASVYSRLRGYAGIVLVVALALWGGAFLLQVLLKRLVSDPLFRLSKMAARIAGGDLRVSAPEDSGDEIGQLAKALNHMTAELARSYSELQGNLKQLQTANKELEAFSYSVSHDLRAPLRHIIGFVDLLFKEAGDRLDENNRHYLEVILDSARIMGNLIDDLLAFSRNSRAEMAMQWFDFNSLLNEVIDDFSVETKGRNIEWNIESLPVIFGDRTLLRQVWANLVSNAIKFTRPRDRAIIMIGSKREENDFIFFIRDNGVGFDTQYQDKLFGLFQRLHDPDEFEGTGVGLANVQRIVRRHGGNVWAESVLGEGAAFYFSLPKKGGAQT